MVPLPNPRAFLLALAAVVGPAGADTAVIESRYMLTEANVDWLSTATIPTRFYPIFGENSERPFFPALGTLIDSYGQLSVGTSVSMSAICADPDGCATTNSVLTFTHAITGQFLGDPTITFSGTMFTASNYPPPEVPFLLNYRGTVDGGGGFWSITATTSEPLRVQHTVTGPTPLIGDRFNIDGDVSIFQRYTPFSSGRYIQDGVVLAQGAGGTTNLSAAAGAAGYVKTLRTSSGATSGGNFPLRNAEYELYGYGAGVAMREGHLLSFAPGSAGAGGLNGFLETPIFQVGASAYYVVKQIGRYVPGAKAAWRAIFGAPPGQTTNLPGTGDFFGGLGSNTRGFFHGVLGGSIATLGNCIDAGDCNRPLPLPGPNRYSRDGSAAAASITVATELVRESSVVEGSTVTATLQQVNAVGVGEVVTAALPAFEDHLVASIGGVITSVRLIGPAEAAANAVIVIGDGEDGSRWSFGDGTFSFVDRVGAPVAAFAVLGLAADLLSPDGALFALGFEASGAWMLQTVSVSAVPELPGSTLFAAGLLLLVVRRGRLARQKN